MTKTRVFLSYARADDNKDYDDASKSFMRRLYDDLTKANFEVWWDRKKLPTRALTFLQEIRDAVAASDKLVLVVGENALISDYVKAEWEFALSQCIPVIPILRQGEYTSIPDALKNYNAPDFRDDTKYKERLVDLVRILSEPTSPLGGLVGVPELPDNYIEREMLNDVRSAVLIDSEKPVVVTAKQRTTTMHGVGGIGKSTLAAAVGRSCEIRRAFPDGVFWVEMGRENVNPLARLSDIGAHFGDVKEEYRDIPRAKQRLSHILRDKRALIIVDDVWEHQHAEAFKLADVRCRVLVTTRLAGMVTTLGGQDKPLGTLTDQEGLELFAQWLETTVTDLPGECALMVEELGGHTQAVNLAAARLKEEGIAYAPDLLRRLREGKVFTTLKLDEDIKTSTSKNRFTSATAPFPPTCSAVFD